MNKRWDHWTACCTSVPLQRQSNCRPSTLRAKQFLRTTMFGSFHLCGFESHFIENFLLVLCARTQRQPCDNPHSPWAVYIQQLWALEVAAVTVWHHELGWQCPSGVLLWSQRYSSTELILWFHSVTHGPRQPGWQPWNESSRAGRNCWQDPGEQLWAKPHGLAQRKPQLI